MITITPKPALWVQERYLCGYCEKELMYLWIKHNNERIEKLLGVGLNRWLICEECDTSYELSTEGIKEKHAVWEKK